MGRSEPIRNFIQVVFDYPSDQGFLWFRDLPWDVRTAVMLPVAVQVLAIIAVAILVARLLSAVSRGTAFQERARRTLTTLGVVGIGGGPLQFAVGVLAWRSGRQEFDPDPDVLGPSQAAMLNQFPFPQWPLTLIIIGVLALALNVAFRAGARLEQELEGVV